MSRFVIVGPAGVGKTTRARHLATFNASTVVHDDPAPATITLTGSWVYVAQAISQVPPAIMRAADTIQVYVPGTRHEFASYTPPDDTMDTS